MSASSGSEVGRKWRANLEPMQQQSRLHQELLLDDVMNW